MNPINSPGLYYEVTVTFSRYLFYPWKYKNIKFQSFFWFTISRDFFHNVWETRGNTQLRDYRQKIFDFLKNFVDNGRRG